MARSACWLFSILALLPIVTSAAPAKDAAASAKAEAELREAIRRYDDALRRGDATAAAQFWADEYVFINPRGERLSRDARIANLREKRTSLDSVAHAPQEEVFHTYMDGKMAVYTTRLSIDGRYGGKAQSGEFRALVVWIYRDNRWQQLASQMTPILSAP